MSGSDNGWTAKREVTLSKWKQTCKHYLEFHQTAHAKHTASIRRMLIFNLLLSGMAIIFNGFVFLNDVTFVVGNICAAVINAVLAGTHVYQKFEGSEAKLSLHESAMKVYKRLHHNMEKEFAQPHGERLDCETFMKNVSMLLLDYEDDFEQPLLSLAVSSAASSNDKNKATVSPSINRDDSNDSSNSNISMSGVSPTLNDNSADSNKSEHANASPVNHHQSRFNSDEDDEKKMLGFTDDQNERFGMFIRRASERERERPMMDYQLKRLSAK
jgi:hypothetical protein